MANLIGKTVADYQIIELIHFTARTEVYKGLQPSQSRYVVVKTLTENAAKELDVLDAFMRYAERAAIIQHPNVLIVLDSGRIDDTYYLVSPFMNFRSLENNQSVYADLSKAQILIEGIVSGLEAIYSHGIVHGNLKPANIILGDQGQPLLTDFGVTTLPVEATTPYNSPEQIEAGFIDRRTDVYALGILLYALLTGQTPRGIINLRAARADLPPSVEQAILKATSQDPVKRFQTPRDFLNALALTFQPPPPAPAPQAPAPQTLPGPRLARSGTNWMPFAIGALLVIIGCLGAVILGPTLFEALNPDPAATEPVAVLPTQLPEEPPPDVQPTSPPVEEPTTPPEQPPGEEPPAEQSSGETPPVDDGGDPGTTPICGSIGLAGGVVLLGGAFRIRRRKRT